MSGALHRAVSRLAWGLLLTACSSQPATPEASGNRAESRDAATGSDDAGTRHGAAGKSTASSPSSLLSDRAYLTRLSLDLRGTRPTIAELDQLAANPAAFNALLNGFLASSSFGPRMAWLWNDTIHTAVWGRDYRRFGNLTFDQWYSIGQEPLQIIQRTIQEDRPFTTIVTSSQLLANQTMAGMWGMPYTGTSGEWAWTAYTDGRPMAGLLSSNTLWQRYYADSNNKNRQRANKVAGMFLCADFFDRQTVFFSNASSRTIESVETAVATDPACLACHSALDPLGSFFGGFTERSQEEPLEQYRRYSKEQADWYAARMPPAYYGNPGRDIGDLGAMMAADPRFTTCAVKRFYEGLVGEPLSDPSELDRLAGIFRDRGLVARAVIRSIVATEAYRTAEERMLTTEQLYSTLVDLTGWDPGTDYLDGLKPLAWSPDHRLLGGGTNDIDVLFRNRAPGVGMHVLLEWAGRQIPKSALQSDLSRPAGERRLMTAGDLSAYPLAESKVREQLVSWHTKFLSEPVAADSGEIDRLYQLWLDMGGQQDPLEAWSQVMAALIRHPRFILY